MLYFILAAFVAGLMFGGVGVGEWKDGQAAKREKALLAAQAKVDAAAAEKTQATANALVDMQAAFDAGQAQREIVTKTVYVKGQDYIKTVPAAQNKDCVIPQEGMEMLNRARAQAAATILGFGDDFPVTIKPPAAPAPPAAPPPKATQPRVVVNPLAPK